MPIYIYLYAHAHIPTHTIICAYVTHTHTHNCIYIYDFILYIKYAHTITVFLITFYTKKKPFAHIPRQQHFLINHLFRFLNEPSKHKSEEGDFTIRIVNIPQTSFKRVIGAFA